MPAFLRGVFLLRGIGTLTRLRPATSVGVQPTNRGLYLLRLTTAGR